MSKGLALKSLLTFIQELVLLSVQMKGLNKIQTDSKWAMINQNITYLEKELIVLDVVNQTGVVLINHSQLITATKQFENILTGQL